MHAVLTLTTALLLTPAITFACQSSGGDTGKSSSPPSSSGSTTYSRCISSTTTTGANCRAGGCLTGETMMPSTTFADASSCGSYAKIYAACYDYSASSTGDYGTCKIDYTCGANKLLGSGGYVNVSDCQKNYVILGWVRCIDAAPVYASSTFKCRPIDAGCKSTEYMSPNSTNGRAYSMNVVSQTLAECTAMTNLKIKCYDLTSGSPSLTCENDYLGCQTGFKRASQVLFPSAASCSNFAVDKWMRCVDTTFTATIKCTPYDPIYSANCSVYTAITTIQRPQYTIFQSQTLCAAWSDPFIRCYDPAVAYTVVSCVPTTTSCSANGKIQIPSNRTALPFSDSTSCNSYVHNAWIRCVNTATSAVTCRPYDAYTYNACPSTERNLPANVIFQSDTACNAPLTEYYLCYNFGSQPLSCSTSSCSSYNFQVARGFYQLSDCEATTVTYIRCIDPLHTYKKRCMPKGASYSGAAINCPSMSSFIGGGSDFYRSSYVGEYKTLDECNAADRYVSWYSPLWNNFICQLDYLGVSSVQLDATYYTMPTYSAPSSLNDFASISDCLAYQPNSWRRCVQYTTGIPKCRPDPVTCIDYRSTPYSSNAMYSGYNPTSAGALTEYLQSDTNYLSYSNCTLDHKYYYCYDPTSNTTSEARNCTNDQVRCSGVQVPVRLDNGKIWTWNATSQCNAATPAWYLCEPTGGAATADLLVCRPAYGTLQWNVVVNTGSMTGATPFCLSGENARAGPYSTVASCDAAKVNYPFTG